MGEHAMHTPHALLAEVERLDATACGAFVVALDDEPVGSLFVERRQVCWVAAVGLGQRLRDLLRQHLAGAGRAAAPEVTEGAMRVALKQHTIESLLALPEHQGEVISWLPHRNAGYRPRFTFTPLELLLAVNARLYAELAAGTEAQLALFGDETTAATYVLGDDDAPMPVCVAPAWTPITAVEMLGEWVAAAFEATPGFSSAVLARGLRGATGTIAVGWRTARRQLHAALISDDGDLARTIDMLERRSYPAVFCRWARSPSNAAVRDDLATADPNP